MKYSILLSTIGKRGTLQKSVSNFQSFLTRNDIEFIIATTNPDFKLKGPGKVIRMKKPNTAYFMLRAAKNKRSILLKQATDRMFFMWRKAADTAKGEWMVFVADDTLLSKNFFDRADQMVRSETRVFQPSLLDPQGYIVCGEYFRSYTVSAVRRRLVYEFNLTPDLHGLTRWLDAIRQACDPSNPHEYIFDSESFCWHLGYPIEGGVPPVIAQWDSTSWIASQRVRFGNRRIDLNENFVG
jgi:hypothetical protein